MHSVRSALKRSTFHANLLSHAICATLSTAVILGCGCDPEIGDPATPADPDIAPADLSGEEPAIEEEENHEAPSPIEPEADESDSTGGEEATPEETATDLAKEGGDEDGARSSVDESVAIKKAELQAQGLSALVGTTGDHGVADLMVSGGAGLAVAGRGPAKLQMQSAGEPVPDFDTETYDHQEANDFLAVTDKPLSTFSIDVDTASYANVRRFLERGSVPPAGAVRLEEMINYFSYDYSPPTDDAPFATHVEVAGCPWAAEHRLVRIGLKGKQVPVDERPAINLVFLLDVSGSMNSPNKLPLVKDALGMLAEQLGENDRVAIVVYAGASGQVLPSTSGADRQAIREALGRLSAGGSTNGGAGIQLAYETAREGFIEGGVNRVVLATDGDFNVGMTDQSELVRTIQDEAKTGVFLTVLGFGMGNYKDSTLEKLADEGNGNYAYIDDRAEARKVLVEQAEGTLLTIAKDVKIQVEFNPAQVGHYRLIGYENRLLADRDFNDDTKDAGEIGAGHTVTALYEVVPVGVELDTPGVDPLKYQRTLELSDAAGDGELLTLKLRYKQPDGDTSQLLTFPVMDGGRGYDQASTDFKFAASVAAWGMVLRDSPHRGSATFDGILELAGEGAVRDPHGYRAEFLDLVRRSRDLSSGT